MAEAFARHFSGRSIGVESAGSMPSDQVSPVVVEAMREKEIDVSGGVPTRLTAEMARRADRVVTMGCDIDAVWPVPGVEAVDWGIEDPSGKSLDEVRPIRDQVEARVADLLAELEAVLADVWPAAFGQSPAQTLQELDGGLPRAGEQLLLVHSH